MKLLLTINMDNDAFSGSNAYNEASRILRNAAEKVENAYREFNLFDINGNRVGECDIVGQPAEMGDEK